MASWLNLAFINVNPKNGLQVLEMIKANKTVAAFFNE